MPMFFFGFCKLAISCIFCQRWVSHQSFGTSPASLDILLAQLDLHFILSLPQLFFKQQPHTYQGKHTKDVENPQYPSKKTSTNHGFSTSIFHKQGSSQSQAAWDHKFEAWPGPLQVSCTALPLCAQPCQQPYTPPGGSNPHENSRNVGGLGTQDVTQLTSHDWVMVLSTVIIWSNIWPEIVIMEVCQSLTV